MPCRRRGLEPLAPVPAGRRRVDRHADLARAARLQLARGEDQEGQGGQGGQQRGDRRGGGQQRRPRPRLQWRRRRWAEGEELDQEEGGLSADAAAQVKERRWRQVRREHEKEATRSIREL